MKEKGFTPLQILKDSLLTMCKLRSKDSNRLIDSHKKFITGFTPLEKKTANFNLIRRHNSLTGFTLPELMVSASIMLIILGAVASTYLISQRLWRSGFTQITFQSTGRIALDKIAKNLLSATGAFQPECFGV